MPPIYQKDSFLFFKEKKSVDSILGDSLIIDPSRISEIIKYVNEKGLKSIRINDAYFKINDLNFLSQMPSIEGLNILQNGLNLSGINELNNLRVLRLGESKEPIDFNNFPNLEILGTTHNRNILNIDKCRKLFWLWLNNFKFNNLKELVGLESLQFLFLHKTTIKNLIGIDSLSNLKELFIDIASKLESLEGLSDRNVKLEFIDIYGAKNLHDYNSIASVQALKRIILIKTGNSKTMSFLCKLQNLNEVSLGMEITDGNLQIISKIPKLSFVEYPHYNFTMKDLGPY